jgi:hypothetical protein
MATRLQTARKIIGRIFCILPMISPCKVEIHIECARENVAVRMDSLRSSVNQLLKIHYQQSDDVKIPVKRIKPLWQSENKYGFLLGMTLYGDEIHLQELATALTNSEFELQEDELINKYYTYYIQPFKQHNGSRCSTSTSQTKSRENSESDIRNTNQSELKLADLKRAVDKRDGVCLFCWSEKHLEAAHIIAQKNNLSVPFDISRFERAGLSDKHQVQNGLLLCSNCHKDFDTLKSYVEPSDPFILKLVNSTSDDNDNAWRRQVIRMIGYRKIEEEYWIGIDNRVATDSNGDMQLYFSSQDRSLEPNRKALESHKVACLIWRMAGGAEPDEEYCSDDDNVDAIQISIQKVHQWNSSATFCYLQDAL